MRREIAARRKANKDNHDRKLWNPESVLKLEQRELLNWIESQLDRLGDDGGDPSVSKAGKR